MVPCILNNISKKNIKIIFLAFISIFSLIFQIISLNNTSYSMLELITDENLFNDSLLNLFIK